jgi:hypothetical protein
VEAGVAVSQVDLEVEHLTKVLVVMVTKVDILHQKVFQVVLQVQHQILQEEIVIQAQVAEEQVEQALM